MHVYRTVVNAGGPAAAAVGVHQAPIEQQNAHAPLPDPVATETETRQEVKPTTTTIRTMITESGRMGVSHDKRLSFLFLLKKHKRGGRMVRT